MKILSVQFKNINSLKLETTISFEEGPLAEAGLFAITGMTGAGKSSILDAITVALYGEVPRHQSGGDVKEIMSRQTGDTYSEVVFQVGETKYRSKWQLRRARGKADGKFQAPKMELANAETGDIIEDKLSNVKKKVVEISGLDFKRFLKSVMLSQGDFAAFLQAKENERAELLERITGTAIYSDISKAAYEKQKEEEEKLKLMSAQLEGRSLLSEEEITELQSDLEKLNEEVESLKKEVANNEAQQRWLEGITERTEKNNQLQAAVAEAQKAHQALAPNLDKLQKFESLSPILGEINSYTTTQKTILKLSTQLNTIKEDVLVLTKSKEGLEEQLKASQAAQVKAQEELKIAQPIIEEVNIQNNQLTNLRDQYEQKRKAQEDATKTYENLAKESSALEKKLKSLNSEWKEIKNSLHNNQTNSHLEKDLIQLKEKWAQYNSIFTQANQQKETAQNLAKEQADLEQEQSALQAKIKTQEEKHRQLEVKEVQLKKMLSNNKQSQTTVDEKSQVEERIRCLNDQTKLAAKYKTQAEAQKKLETTKAESLKELEKQNESIAQLQTTIAKEEKLLVTLQKLREQEKLVAKYEDDRINLEEGKACPLCGSTEHPFNEGHNQDASKTEQEIQAQNQLVEQSKKSLNQAEKRIVKIQAEQDKYQAQEAQIKQQLAELTEDFIQLNEKTKLELHITEPLKIQSCIQTLQSALEKVNSVLEKSAKSRVELESLQTQLKESQTQLSAIQKEENETDKALQIVLEKINAVSQNTNSSTANLEVLEQEIAQVLKVHGYLFDQAQMNDSLQILEKQIQTYKDNQEKNIQLEKEIATLSTKEQNSQQQLQKEKELSEVLTKETATLNQGVNEVVKKIEKLSINFQSKDTKGELIRLQTNVEKATQKAQSQQAQFIEVDKNLSQQNTLFQQLENEKIESKQAFSSLSISLTAALAKRGWENIEQAQNYFLSEEEINTIRVKKSQVEENLTSLKAKWQQNQEELEKAKEQKLTEEEMSSLQEKQTQLSVQLEEKTRQNGGITQQLAANEKLKNENSELTSQIALQEKEWIRWKKLSDLIGSANGDKFRKFAQGLTLAQLVHIANRYVEKLNPRYFIEQLNEEGKELELQIVDLYQANTKRSMKSLSGGESFLISLALALGLSELAGGNTNIQSLFIDEGFGSLDATTLDMAITTLENLQTEGKTIGVISHVEALKERITTQIQVQKQSGGFSTVEVVG